MSQVREATGGCVCGAVTITAKTMSTKVGACHCTTCRKWGGGPFMGVDCSTDVSFGGEDHITVYQSSMWAERGFCNQCGSHLFYRLKGNGQHIMPVGLFGEGDYHFDHQIFIDKKPDYYCFSNQTEDMTGAELFAKFGPSGG